MPKYYYDPLKVAPATPGNENRLNPFTMKTTHTPLPWILQTDENDIFTEIVDSATEGIVVATFPLGRPMADAALIVRAVNSHAELLAALKELCADRYLSDPINADRMKNARAAIAKAESA